MKIVSNAQSGLSFYHLWRGVSEKAKKYLDLLFSMCDLSVGTVRGRNKEEQDQCLRVSDINLSGTTMHTLMDSGDFLNVISPKVVRELSTTLECSRRAVTVANESNTGFLGEVKDVPVTVRDAVAKMDLVVLCNLPFDALIGRSAIVRLVGFLDLQNSEVHFTIVVMNTTVAVVPEHERPTDLNDETPSE